DPAAEHGEHAGQQAHPDEEQGAAEAGGAAGQALAVGPGAAAVLAGGDLLGGERGDACPAVGLDDDGVDGEPVLVLQVLGDGDLGGQRVVEHHPHDDVGGAQRVGGAREVVHPVAVAPRGRVDQGDRLGTAPVDVVDVEGRAVVGRLVHL